MREEAHKLKMEYGGRRKERKRENKRGRGDGRENQLTSKNQIQH
jgi:hypothetical protein